MADDDSKKSSALEDDDHEDDLFYDPLDEFALTEEDLRNVMSSPNPTLMDLNLPPLDPPTTPYMEINETQLMHELSLSITDCDINDDFLISWDMDEPSNDDLDNIIDLNVTEEIGNDNSGITIVGSETTTRLEVSTRVFGNTNGPNFEIGGPSTMPVPVTSTIFDGSFVCTCCSLLRELVHTNGSNLNRLTIYGGIGFFCHAILETQRDVGYSIERRYQTFHLKDLTMEAVKKFIEEYCFQIQSDGLSLVEDINSAFYQAMIANSISNQTLMVPIPSRMSLPTPDEVLNVPPVPPQDEPTTSSKKGKGKGKGKAKRKTALALQRERTGKMTLKDINMHFHLPIEQAARIMRLCPTVLKKICRKGGLMRWPHRKIKCMEDKIERLENVVRTAKNDVVRARAQQETENLRKKIAEICSNILKNYK
ncbi:Protein NLP1 [Cardamine amara subsp. amara]|uniref:Protein NLP1 n=1 Tax=Cardamine amara subsp. amara TaxID=228776 RepID=A0ABD1AID4_CARAN